MNTGGRYMDQEPKWIPREIPYLIAVLDSELRATPTEMRSVHAFRMVDLSGINLRENNVDIQLNTIKDRAKRHFEVRGGEIRGSKIVNYELHYAIDEETQLNKVITVEV